MRFKRYGSGIRWEGKDLWPVDSQRSNAIGVPSAGLSLGWLLASRANLRFTRRVGDSRRLQNDQERSDDAGQEGWQGCS